MRCILCYKHIGMYLQTLIPQSNIILKVASLR